MPFVPRPSLVPDPITAFGKRKTTEDIFRPSRGAKILLPSERAKIKPAVLLDPPKPYQSVRDLNREKILSSIQLQRQNEAMDVILPRLHKVAENPSLPYKQQIVANSDLPPYIY